MQLIKTGLCAFGMSGRVFHAPFLNEHPGFHMSAIVERTKHASQEKYPYSTIYRSVEQMLEHADIDLVVVNTPVQTHFDYTLKALEAGKHVIVEKPFTVNAYEARKLVCIAQDKGLFLSVYQNRRFDRDFLQVKKILSEKKLGNIKEVEIRFDRFRTESKGKEHKENPHIPAAGALHDLGAHLVDQAIQLFGFPEKLFADIFSMKGPSSANDYFEIILYYARNLRVRLKSSVFVKEDTFAYKLHGDRGSLLQQRSDHQEAELLAGTLPKFQQHWQKPLSNEDGIIHYLDDHNTDQRLLLKSHAGDYMVYYQKIYEHILLGQPLPSPGEEIIFNMKLIDQALESAKRGTIVSV
ncbi:Gfo/Idh/MocA family oxidoreductase [Elizabethkingia argentiflava]|uniref:Gfo/Idh/MocA family oxidoreductase n=1 Tax=Elizabethkingia argenteiflava TaxID=2681556 RepID=A0A845PTZ8_9FLAO|nr:Gfo/Idh/MocA family oxidoreductase [Elizabethkingia argenteiflava]NAW50543.1 Gfo/Idh/MocA family oxidoreductase [Elizabethkingia argenteiflava]